MKKLLLLILFILLSSSVLAIEGHMTLLTVGEIGNTTIGGTADLFLEIQPGSGRVFIDSFPLTKVDTQISTRFAKEVACDFLEMDCSNKDFFYTIRAKAPIVGGPSAGSAITVLTISLLDRIPLNENVVMTGTINSGGLIGPVAGIEEKAQAAQRSGFEKILIPKWSILRIDNESTKENLNKTENDSSLLNETIIYADELNVTGIEVITVSTLEEALEQFTGKQYKKYDYNITIPDKYNNIMRKISVELCERFDTIFDRIPQEVLLEHNLSINRTNTSMTNAREAMERGDYYSAASFCFSANTVAKTVEFSNYSNETLVTIKRKAQKDLDKMMTSVDSIELKTVSDLETYIIVKERLYEAQNLLEKNDSEVLDNLGYIMERFYSAIAWSAFFDYKENEVNLDDTHLAQACLSKIQEAEERTSYVSLLIGDLNVDEDPIQELREIYSSKDYAFCLFRASKTKADANALLSTLALTNEKLPELINDKLHLGKSVINKQGDKFPILGYSYYNYANSLKDSNAPLAVIFSEYSIELSNLDMYFPKEKHVRINFDPVLATNILLGFILGIVVSFFVFSRKNRTAKKKK